MTIEVTILGCGSSGGVPLIGNIWGPCDPNDSRNIRRRVSILVKKNKKAFLVDTSPDLRMQMLDANIKDVDAVLYTHSHADHVHGIDDLRAFCWQRKDNKPLPIYSDQYTIDQITKRFDYAFENKYGPAVPSLAANTISIGNNTIQGVNVEAIKQVHGKGFSLGYRFDNVAYSTDVNNLPEESMDQLKNLDLWIVDCVRYEPHYSHSHFDQTISWIKQLKPKKAILTHMGHWLDYNELKNKCPDNVEPGIDGMVIKV
ncbi:MBL fold metallo-hydrolase [Alphaproteobacteria bacterium]|jgi:phosphoribosyl 1,2-cyclic phosphate phosphodiesterase|nr:MBL fold metallo-hydrolase [Alphaproteobacteria bacterium]